MAEIEIPNLTSTGGQVNLTALTGVLGQIADVVNDVSSDEPIDGGPA